MTKVYVIDPEDRPSRAPHPTTGIQPNPIRAWDAGFRIMECDIVGWVSGRHFSMVIYGDTAVPPIGAQRTDRAHQRAERWQVFEDKRLGGWVAWVVRQKDDARERREAKDRQVEILIASVLLFVAAVVAAFVLVVIPQCNSNTGIGSLPSPPPLGNSAPPAREQGPADGRALVAVAPF